MICILYIQQISREITDNKHMTYELE
jgi:hypothetical protein